MQLSTKLAARAMVGVMAMMLVMAGPAAAVAPSNDDVANATPIWFTPFSEWVDLTDATTEAGEYFDCINAGMADRSAWYSWTVPEDGVMVVVVDGLWEGTTVGVFGPFETLPTAAGDTGNATWCVNHTGPDFALAESVFAGQTYLFQLSAPSWYPWATISVALDPPPPPPPANDDFANATQVSELPFDEWVDMSGATLEADEPIFCDWDVTDRSVWYSYTAPEDGNVSVSLDRTEGLAVAAVYRYAGESFPWSGEEPRCTRSDSDDALRMPVVGGETYLIQVKIDGTYGSPNVRVLIQPGPPRLEIQVAAAATGGVNRVSGIARISVGIACTAEAQGVAGVNLRQRLTRTVVAIGHGDLSVPCGPVMTWTDVYVSGDRPFAPGMAALTISAGAYNGWEWQEATAEATVKLRNER